MAEEYAMQIISTVNTQPADKKTFAFVHLIFFLFRSAFELSCIQLSLRRLLLCYHSEMSFLVPLSIVGLRAPHPLKKA